MIVVRVLMTSCQVLKPSFIFLKSGYEQDQRAMIRTALMKAHFDPTAPAAFAAIFLKTSLKGLGLDTRAALEGPDWSECRGMD